MRKKPESKEFNGKVFTVGQVVSLDCGYGGGPDDRDCKILSLDESKTVFGGVELVGEVEILGTGEKFTAVLSPSSLH